MVCRDKCGCGVASRLGSWRAGITLSAFDAFQPINHYSVLGLSEASSSATVASSFGPNRWPWHLATEQDRANASERCRAAYHVLNDPVSRAAYDKQNGYTIGHLAAVIGDWQASWGRLWLAMLVLAALIVFLGSGDQARRVVGSKLAPGFDEVAVLHQAEPCGPQQVVCLEASYFEREFRSTSDFWQSILAADVAWWTLPPAILVLSGLLLGPVVNRAAGYAVAAVRLVGYRDTFVRAALVVPVLALPLAFIAFYFLSAPDAVDLSAR